MVAEMATRGYPVIVGGFGLPEDAIHAPNESYALRASSSARPSARELLQSLAAAASVKGEAGFDPFGSQQQGEPNGPSPPSPVRPQRSLPAAPK